MRCPNCGNEIPEGKRLCSHCGHRLVPADSQAAPASAQGRTASSWKWVAGFGAAVVVIVGLVIALASRGKPAVPPTPTPGAFDSPIGTPMPTSNLGAFVSPLGTPTPGASVSPLDTPTPRPGSVLYSDDFSDIGSGWYEGSFEDKEYHYEKGEYVILVKKGEWSAWASWPKERFTDFTLEADVRLVEGPQTAEMGLVFRLGDEGNFYYFRINGYGQYMVGKDVNGEWQDFEGVKMPGPFGLEWPISPHIKTGGATNRLKVVCQGSQIALYVNGHHLTTVSDESFAEGKIGLIAVAIEPSEYSKHSVPVKVVFDNLVVSVAEDIP